MTAEVAAYLRGYDSTDCTEPTIETVVAWVTGWADHRDQNRAAS